MTNKCHLDDKIAPSGTTGLDERQESRFLNGPVKRGCLLTLGCGSENEGKVNRI